jgi:hypothetical protein
MEIIKLTIKRGPQTKHGILGDLYDDKNNLLYYTLERPWLNNRPNVSCVPPGWYETEWYNSPKQGRKVLQLKNVIGRTYIQLHRTMFFYALLGCIGIGFEPVMAYSKMYKYPIIALKNSEEAVQEFENQYLDEKILIIIEDQHNCYTY